MSKIKIWLLKELIKHVHIPEGDVLDQRKAKVSKIANLAHNNDAHVKRYEALKAGVN